MEVTDRRNVIGLGLATVTAFTLAACDREAGEKGDGDEDVVTANEDLMREHGVLRRILIIYREAAAKLTANVSRLDAAALAQATEIFRAFGERYHEQQLEEQHIFPILRKSGGANARLVDVLNAQHKRGREITAHVLDRTRGGSIPTADGDSLAKVLTAFARMYEAHAAREDTIIFPAFRQALGEDGYRELGEQFEDIERRMFGADGFEAAAGKVAEVEAVLGLADLGVFTASPLPAQA